MPVANLLRPQPAPPISQPSKDSSKAGGPAEGSSFSHKLAKAKKQAETATAQVQKSPVKPVAPANSGAPVKPAAPRAKEPGQDDDGAADHASSAGESTGPNTVKPTDGPDAEVAQETEDAATGEESAPVKQAIAAGPPAAQKKLTPATSAQINQTDARKNSDTGVIVANPAGQVQTPPEAGNATGENSAVAPDEDSIDVVLAPGARYGAAKVVASPGGNSAEDGSTSAGATNGSNAPSGEGATAIDPALAPVVTPMALTAEAGGKGANSVDKPSDSSAAPSGISALTDDKGLFPTVGKASSPTASPQAQFIETNQPKILSSIQGQLLPNGGTMQIRLTPPELGNLQITVQMRDGVMAASFETSSEHATKFLSQSLGQLKTGLEAAGMSVEKLQVQQAPRRDAGNDGDSDSKHQPQEQQQQAQQDQQRREMLQRMWSKLTGAGDPLDLVA